MEEHKKNKRSESLKTALHDLKSALSEWDKIPHSTETPDDELMKKTKQLVRELSRKIQELDL